MHVLILHTMDVDGLQIEQSDIKNRRVRKYGVEDLFSESDGLNICSVL
jgi:hypothetical protein